MFFFISTFDSIPPLCLTSSDCRSFFIPPFCGWTSECISPFHGGSARTLSTLREWGGNEPTDCTPLLTVIYQFQEKIQEAQFASSTQLTAYYREKEEELLKEKEVVEEKKRELDAGLQRY